MINRRKFLIASVLLPVMGFVACSKNTPKVPKLPPKSPISALGDSLTFGYGVDKSQSYPALLAQKTTWQVDNDGISGNTTTDVLERLPSILAKNPKLVLLGIGGNDVLRRTPPETTKANLLKIIGDLQGKSIPVVLIAQPHLSASALFGKASDNPVYKEVASSTGVPLLANVWSEILSDNSLKSDQIHANAAGYAQFTDKLYQFLQELGYA